MKSASHIAKLLLSWHDTIERYLPWKDSNDPYKIWLSEIILQQTRVAQGMPYYLKFVEAYPTVADLAAAPQDEVLRLWQGLGYYSRARNMHYSAQVIVEKYGGLFPRDYADILGLKGVGKYTAAAIASFAYGDAYPVVDGNVLRVVSRLHGIQEPIDQKATVDRIYQYSEQYISKVDAGNYNQAIMDLGSLVCSPKSPKCEECPFDAFCVAKKEDLITHIPFKSKKVKKRDRHFHYFIINVNDTHTVLRQRVGKDIWQGLYDFPCIENTRKTKLSKKEIAHFLSKEFSLKPDIIAIQSVSEVYKHILSHQNIYARFYHVNVDALETSLESGYLLIDRENISDYGMPVLLTKYL